MFPIARHHAHYVFAVLQSGLTTLVASGIASAPMIGEQRFWLHWLSAWVIAWLLMIPVVLAAAPGLRRASVALTRADPEQSPLQPIEQPRPDRGGRGHARGLLTEDRPD